MSNPFKAGDMVVFSTVHRDVTSGRHYKLTGIYGVHVHFVDDGGNDNYMHYSGAKLQLSATPSLKVAGNPFKVGDVITADVYDQHITRGVAYTIIRVSGTSLWFIDDSGAKNYVGYLNATLYPPVSGAQGSTDWANFGEAVSAYTGEQEVGIQEGSRVVYKDGTPIAYGVFVVDRLHGDSVWFTQCGTIMFDINEFELEGEG